MMKGDWRLVRARLTLKPMRGLHNANASYASFVAAVSRFSLAPPACFVPEKREFYRVFALLSSCSVT